MTTWRTDDLPAPVKFGPLQWGVSALRGGALVLLIYGGLVVLLVLRVVEWPFSGRHRPLSPYVTQAVSRCSIFILGIRYRVRGTPMPHPGAVVANHASWLDIFALNACQRVYFVSKSEVAGWPGIGWLARATGTVFIDRNPKKAKAQQDLFDGRIRAGHKLLFFPEGTSTDTLRVLPFKSTLFAAFFANDLVPLMHIQPVSVRYFAPKGRDRRFYGWWGDMIFGPHFVQTLGQWRQGSIEVVFHRPLRVTDFPTRKALAASCEAMVRSGVETGKVQTAAAD